jgi:3-oxoacyl-[acyl-carrier-protein] synthase-3
MTYAAIQAIEYYLPPAVLTNEQLAVDFPDFSADKIFVKTGIRERHIASADQFSSDMAILSANRMFDNQKINRIDVDFLIFCTQTPDYLLPTTACMIQDRLGLKKTIGSLDVNLGCSGFVYGLSIAKGLIESKQVKNVLLLTADTYSKLMERTDKSVRTLFGDGAAATLVANVSAHSQCITPVMFGTDGSGWMNLCVRGRGVRSYEEKGADPYLRMQGPEIFSFTLDAVPKLITELLLRENLAILDIDMFVFHQANYYILEHLRKKIGIPADKMLLSMDFCGNTVSSTIPIALKEAQNHQKLVNCHKVMLVGFGVGYSWAAAIVDCGFIV